jgi:hypothetical protein
VEGEFCAFAHGGFGAFGGYAVDDGDVCSAAFARWAAAVIGFVIVIIVVVGEVRVV